MKVEAVVLSELQIFYKYYTFICKRLNASTMYGIIKTNAVYIFNLCIVMRIYFHHKNFLFIHHTTHIHEASQKTKQSKSRKEKEKENYRRRFPFILLT